MVVKYSYIIIIPESGAAPNLNENPGLRFDHAVVRHNSIFICN